MWKALGKGWFQVGLACLLSGTIALARTGPPERITPPQVKPLAVRTVAVQPWEESSVSPFGGQRWGGVDQRSFAFSPDGKLLAAEDAGGWQLELWDVNTGKSLGRFGQIDDPVALAFSPDSRTLATTSWGHHNRNAVELWDVAGRKRLRGLDEDVNLTPFSAIAFSPDGKTLALAAGLFSRGKDQNGIHLWDVVSGDEVRRLGGPRPLDERARRRVQTLRDFDCACFAPDGRSLALVRDRQILLLELATGKERGLLGVLPALPRPDSGIENIASVAYSPDGRVLAVAWADGLIRLWDAVAGSELLPLAGPTGRVRAIQFSADGKTLLSFGQDNKVLTWSVADARRTWRLPPREKLSREALAGLCEEIRSDDPVVRYWAVRTLADFPDQTLPLLRERLKPVPPVAGERIRQLVAQLVHEDFNERKKAIVEVRKLGDLAIPALEQARESGYQDIHERLLRQFELHYPTREQVQLLRFLEVLERIGTEEARRLLDELAKGAPEALLTQQSKASRERLRQKVMPGGEANLEALWTDLASEDSRRGFAALRALVGRPKEAVPFLRDRLRPLAAHRVDDSPQQIARWIADLDSDTFAVRQKASRELTKLGKRAAPALQKALVASPGLEARKRMEEVLKGIARPVISPEQSQIERALETLERIGTEEAREAVGLLSREAQSRWWKEALADSQRRLGR